jgi:hypothetical protein
MGLTTSEIVTVAVGLVNTIVVPGAIFMLKSMIDKAADARSATVRSALIDHEGHDERRFKEMSDQMEKTEDTRDHQHVQNQSLLTELRTDVKWVKTALLKLPMGD